MECIRRFLFAFLLIMWSMNGSAFDYEGIIYDVLSESDKTALVARQSMDMTGDVQIPNQVSYNGSLYTVTEISKNAFAYCREITSVSIPATVQIIGANAFDTCISLTSVSMGNGIKAIPFMAFNGCSSLQEVTVPEGTERLENGAFNSCSNLTAIHLPQSLLSIGNYVFEGCNKLTDIVIPDQVTELGGYAFYECKELSSVRLSDNITEICDWTFTRCYKLKDINIPKNLQRLGDHALFWCSSIEELTFPRSLTEISNNALLGCQGLRSLTVENGNPKYLSEDGVLFNHDKTTLLLFPAQSDITNYVIPTTVTTIVPAAFSGSQLKSITLPPLLTEIGNSAFIGLVQLEHITIPSSVTSIGSSALRGCTSLKEVDIPEGVQSIGTAALAENPSLVRVHLPKGLTRIEGWTFDGCTSLSEVNVPEGVNYIGMAAFRNCSSLPAFQIPQGVTIIDDYAFMGCQTLTELTIPDNVEKVGWDAFSGCSRLEKVTIGRSVKALEGGTFYGCENIRKVWSYIEEPFDVNDIERAPGEVLESGRCFHETVTREATLYVPNGTKEKYLAKRGWRDFVTIQTAIAPDDDMAYHPFLKEGKTWNYEEYYRNGEPGEEEEWTRNISYVLNGTTEIDGKTYYKMYRVTEEGSEYYCALREEDRKVWMHSSNSETCLLYDFGMSLGDRYKTSVKEIFFQLSAIKPMRFQYNQLLNVLYYDIYIEGNSETPDYYFYSTPIVEGVGCDAGWNFLQKFEPVLPNLIYHRETFKSCYEDGQCIFTADDFNKLPKPDLGIPYRPFIEEDKVWKVGTIPSSPDSPVQIVDYYYLDGDTIVDGKTYKQMWCQRYVSSNYPDYDYMSQQPSLSKVGAWYEENQKVYFYNEEHQIVQLKYDFSLDPIATLDFLNGEFVIGPKLTGLEGFKGVYRDIMTAQNGDYCTTWLEGVGDVNGPTRYPCDPILGDPVPEFLMSCTVGDEVIYLNDKYEDGATPKDMAKKRFDFTHTTKLQPKAPIERENSDASISSSEREVARPKVKVPRRGEEELSLYGEYNNLQLGIHLDPLDDAYQVSITNESGKVVYEKTINAGTIVGLSIDISAYAKGRYNVTVENSNELFTGEFETETTGIEETMYNKVEAKSEIYNLQGQRIHSLQKGLNIYGGRKIVK